MWMGVSVETSRYAFRVDHLRSVGAAVRLISPEPLLGPLPNVDLSGIHWLTAGGESGPRARPIRVAWVRDLRDQCAAAGSPSSSSSGAAAPQSQRPRARRHPPRRHARGAGAGVGRSCGRRRRQPVPEGRASVRTRRDSNPNLCNKRWRETSTGTQKSVLKWTTRRESRVGDSTTRRPLDASPD